MVVIKKISRWIIYAFALLLALCVLILAIVRFAIYPNIDKYKTDIAAQATKALGQKVTIGNITTGWDNLSPHFVLKDIDVFDAESRPALRLGEVETTLSWLSIPLMQPRLSQLIVHQPELTIRRKEDGIIYLAGISLAGESKPDFANWLLSQAEVKIENANLIWLDDFRKAPPLSLNKLNLTLKNPAWRKLFGQHLFTVSAIPSTGTKLPVEANGSFFGRDVSEIQAWHGEIYLQTDETDLTAWKAWLDYPVDIQRGIGDAKLWLEFDNSQFTSVKSILGLKNLVTQLSQQAEPFAVEHFSGKVNWNKDNRASTVNAQEIKLKASSGLNIEGGSGHLTQSTRNNKPWVDVAINFNQFNLSSIKQLQAYAKIPEDIASKISALSPRGALNDVSLSWVGEPQNPSHYHIKTQFKAFSINAHEHIPGFENLSGNIDANQNNGELVLQSTNANLDLKDILRWPIPANQLNGKITWKINDNKPFIVAKNLYISNPHITGTVDASYNMNGVKGGYLDLSGNFGKGNAKYAPFYYPIILGKSTLHWLDSSILSGKAEDIHLTVKGSLADFPYVTKDNKLDTKLGLFRVSAKISDAVVEYGTDWPVIEGLGLNMLFEGKRMELNANKGHIFSNKIIESKVEIPQLDADWPMLNIISDAEGTVADGIRFVNESPVKEVALGFTDGLKTAGKGKLHLELKIPMEDLESAKYKGAYKITDGTIFAIADIGLPELSKINGTLNFTDNNLSAQEVNAQILGGPASFSLNTGSDKIIRINASGHITDVGIKKVVSNSFTNTLQGSTDWTGAITIKKPLVDLSIRSNLAGMAVQLPAPLGKSASQPSSLTIDKKQLNSSEDAMNISYGEAVSAKIFRKDSSGTLAFERGDIGINVDAVQPAEAGLSLHGKLDYVNADEWLAIFNKQNNKSEKSVITINKADLSIQKLNIFNRMLNALKIVAKPTDTGLQMGIESQEITGNAEWQSPKNESDAGKIIAKLKNLTIPRGAETISSAEKKEIKRLDRKYPALDITADNFQLGSKQLGSLALNAYEVNEDWLIQSLKISNPDSTLQADGTWHNWSRNPNTYFKFTLITENVGKTLKRFGQPDMIKDGEAEMSGQLRWPGSPHEFETDGLSGNFKLEAKKGQILKAQPGVGRLLGLLSLQSLPRRLTLDFRDLFSEGFAFDKITATAKINNGIMYSDDFFMTGPAAEAKIKGETNLQKETQNIKVKVTPHISDSLSLAALAGGPVAGAAAFVAQKLLKDPFNKIGQSEYVITGTWDNPKEVEPASDKSKKPNNDSPLTQ